MRFEHARELETDARFPSGKWTGFFLQSQGPRPGRHKMELHLTFENGAVSGMNAGERKPMVPRDLPRYARRRTQRHYRRNYVRGVARTMTKAMMPVNDA